MPLQRGSPSPSFSPERSAINETAVGPGSAADRAEERKHTLYSNLQGTYRFEPLAIETTGVYGRSSSKLVSKLGKRISNVTGDRRETQRLRQGLSVAIIRGNSSSILATGCSDID